MPLCRVQFPATVACQRILSSLFRRDLYRSSGFVEEICQQCRFTVDHKSSSDTGACPPCLWPRWADPWLQCLCRVLLSRTRSIAKIGRPGQEDRGAGRGRAARTRTRNRGRRPPASRCELEGRGWSAAAVARRLGRHEPRRQAGRRQGAAGLRPRHFLNGSLGRLRLAIRASDLNPHHPVSVSQKQRSQEEESRSGSPDAEDIKVPLAF